MVSHKSLVCPIIHAISTYYKNVSIPCGFEAIFNQMLCIVGGVGTLYIHTVWVIGSWYLHVYRILKLHVP